MTYHRCACGKRRSMHVNTCRECHKRHMATQRAKIDKIVADGRCPKCEAPLRRNSALAGWWQCSQFGAERFRTNPDKPECHWQGFGNQ